MESKFKITIPKPCHEDWNAMTPEETGRFCSVCTKGVVDFTNKTTEEIHPVINLLFYIGIGYVTIPLCIKFWFSSIITTETERKWNGNGTEMERKWNGTGTKRGTVQERKKYSSL